MTYKKSDMVFTDYQWTAKADHDNPKIIGGADRSELNRTEGYEMLYFLNSLAHSWQWNNVGVGSYQHLEKSFGSKYRIASVPKVGLKHGSKPIIGSYKQAVPESY